MASPCEILIEADELSAAQVFELISLGAAETWRIEAAFSRYRNDNIIYQINNSQGKAVAVDAETAGLLNYASRCFELSDGMFDISSGLLRQVWRFDGRIVISIDEQKLARILALVGWDKCQWHAPNITIPAGAELDLGGIGKEYAVDKTLQLLLSQEAKAALLVNLGGDLACSGARQGNQPWLVGVESIAKHSPLQSEGAPLALRSGALATSGDSYRYVIYQGKKLSHVLNPKTGYPVAAAPQSVTVAASSCTLAGMLATFAMLHGAGAEDFLAEQKAVYWLQRL